MNQLDANKPVIRDDVAPFNHCDPERLRPLFTADAVAQGVLGWGARDSTSQACQIGMPLS